MNPKDTKIPPSDMFIDSIQSGGGSHDATCGFCGRQHYCPDSSSFYSNDFDDMDEEDAYAGYLEQALEEQRADPDGVVIHRNVDFVYMKDMNGMTFVVECPCNGLRRYEDFIWAHAEDIQIFLKKRTEQEMKWLEEQQTIEKLLGNKK